MQRLASKLSIRKVGSFTARASIFFGSGVFLYFLMTTVSNDYESYQIIWDMLKGTNFLESYIRLRYEIGSLFVLWSLANIFSAKTMIFIIGLISLAIKYTLFNKYLNYPALAFICYVIIFAHILDANQIRVAMSVCVLFYACFVPPKTRLTYLYLTIIAVFFHYSGIVILFFYFIRSPVFLIVGIFLFSFVFDSLVSSSDYFAFAMIWQTASSGSINLAASPFIMQLCLALVCAARWNFLSEGQKRGALLNLVGVIVYVSFLDNPIVAHRVRELTQVGMIPILFLGEPRLTNVKFFTGICFAYAITYNTFAILSEVLGFNGGIF